MSKETSKYLFLPELDKEKSQRVPKPKNVGTWENQDHGIFMALSDAILTRDEPQGINSVPSIWARPLMFRSALMGNKHPLRERCIKEWRGLLSLIALSEYKTYSIEIVPVKLDEDNFPRLSKSLNLTPKSIQLEEGIEYIWKDILLIRYKGQKSFTIGAFSPSTLVYTAANYNHLLKEESISLKDEEGFLCPPKDEEELMYIGVWLNNLKVKFFGKEAEKGVIYSSQKNPDIKIVNDINTIINNWFEEISQGQDIRSEKVEVSEERIRLTKIPEFLKPGNEKYNVYKVLLYPLKKMWIEGETRSDISLKWNRNESKYSEVIVITEKSLGSRKKIWDTWYLRDLIGNDADVEGCIKKFFENKEGYGTAIKGEDIGKYNAIWIRPENYFLTDTLLKSKDGDFLMDTEEEYNSGTYYILPFKKEILNFFSPEDIKEILKPTFKEYDGNVHFTFSLPTKIGIEKVEKVYKMRGSGVGEGTITQIEVPVVEIFPKYLGPHWRRYYVFQGNAQNITVNPVVFGENTLTSRQREETSPEFKQKIKITEISGDNAFPEGLEIKINKALFAGLILIQRTHKTKNLTEEWSVGIDFGTSNTNIYKYQKGSDKAERWMFDFPNYIRRISASRDEIRDRLLQDYFVPTERIDLPTPTTLKIFNSAQKDNLLLDYFIFFPRIFKLPNNIYSNIKWEAEDRKTKYFIESILFLILIEAIEEGIENIKFLCAYPKAFTPEDLTVLKYEWKTVLKKMVAEEPTCVLNLWKDTSDESKKIIIGNKVKTEIEDRAVIDISPNFKTEGKAAGEYFGSTRTMPSINENLKIAGICLDVGGGTTDISIWYENDIVFDASVLLAGRQISQLFLRYRRLIELLFTKDAVISLEEQKNEPELFSARLNLILMKEEKRIQEMLIEHARKEDIRWLRRLLSLEFCALSFYTAILTGYTDKTMEHAGNLLERVKTAGMQLYWGGNAAKFINWIDFGKYDREGDASKMLSAVYFNCLKDLNVKPNQLSHFQSPAHKSEVAGGLVVMELEQTIRQEKHEGSNDPQRDAEKSRQTERQEKPEVEKSESDMQNEEDIVKTKGVVCGENIELLDRNVNFTDFITEKDLFIGNKTQFKGTTLEKLTRFIDILNLFGINRGLFTEDTKIYLTEKYKRTIRDAVRNEFIKAQSLDSGKRLIEPVFIMEVKILLELLRSELR